MNKFWSKNIRELSPYVPGEQPKETSVIKLNTNENPYPPSPAVLEAIRSAANSDLRLYPDPDGTSLKRVIANIHDISPDNVFLGNGSDEVLAHTFLALLNHSLPVLFPDITYGFYPVFCALYNIDYEEIPLDDQFQIVAEAYARPNGGIVLPNPNAQTGCALKSGQLQFLLERCTDSVVAIDEAYVDFGAESAIPLINEFPNLIVIQTMSKSRSLAGLRVGYALGNPNLIEALCTVKGCFNSYPLDRLALAGAEAALLDSAYYDETRNKIMENREWLKNELEALGFFTLPSKANFLFVKHASLSAEKLHGELRNMNVLVRHIPKGRATDFLRITIGTLEECRKLIDCMRQLEIHMQ